MEAMQATGSSCMRSLGAELLSAATTFAFFVATNWGSSSLYELLETNSCGFTTFASFHAISAVGFPQWGLVSSLCNTIDVWKVKMALKAFQARQKLPDDCQLDRRCIPIMVLCPIFLEVVGAAPNSLQEVTSEMGTNCSREVINDLQRPLELEPAARKHNCQCNSPEADHKANITADATPIQVNTQAPQNINTVQADGEIRVDLQDTAATSVKADVEDNSYVRVESMRYRAALLLLNLAPDYDALKYVRVRSRFQSVVTGLQAGGYLLGLLQRVVQHLHIAPLEAVLFFLCLLVVLQLLVEPYACGNYQRPLLLRLTPAQFSCLNHTSENNHPHQNVLARVSDEDNNSHDIEIILSNLIVLGVGLPISIAYTHSYRKEAPISTAAVLLFYLSVLASSTSLTCLFVLLNRVPPRCEKIVEVVLRCILFCGMVGCAGGMGLALVATVRQWHTFQTLPRNWFAWILPHA